MTRVAISDTQSRPTSTHQRQIDDLTRSPNKYIFESKDFEHFIDLSYGDIYNHIYERFKLNNGNQAVTVNDENLNTFLECPCWLEHDESFGGNKFV